EAPRPQLAVIRRTHRRAEDLAEGLVIGRRLGELGRAAAGGQGVDRIHRGTVFEALSSLAWRVPRPTPNRPKKGSAKPIDREATRAVGKSPTAFQPFVRRGQKRALPIVGDVTQSPIEKPPKPD